MVLSFNFSPTLALLAMNELLRLDVRVSAIIGPGCSAACELTQLLVRFGFVFSYFIVMRFVFLQASNANLPQVSFSCLLLGLPFLN